MFQLKSKFSVSVELEFILSLRLAEVLQPLVNLPLDFSSNIFEAGFDY